MERLRLIEGGNLVCSVCGARFEACDDFDGNGPALVRNDGETVTKTGLWVEFDGETPVYTCQQCIGEKWGIEG